MPFKVELEIKHDERKGLVFETKKEKQKENSLEEEKEKSTNSRNEQIQSE